ncbi:hypothetical protein BC835DRAFT_1419861 [Cytidiella melzeri]|nr:hypothetical protein BC835DRAFT_1419861 [Cytidiella melzeri]
MHFPTSLALFAIVVTGVFHDVTVSAIPYGYTGSRSAPNSGNPDYTVLHPPIPTTGGLKVGLPRSHLYNRWNAADLQHRAGGEVYIRDDTPVLQSGDILGKLSAEDRAQIRALIAEALPMPLPPATGLDKTLIWHYVHPDPKKERASRPASTRPGVPPAVPSPKVQDSNILMEQLSSEERLQLRRMIAKALELRLPPASANSDQTLIWSYVHPDKTVTRPSPIIRPSPVTRPSPDTPPPVPPKDWPRQPPPVPPKDWSRQPPPAPPQDSPRPTSVPSSKWLRPSPPVGPRPMPSPSSKWLRPLSPAGPRSTPILSSKWLRPLRPTGPRPRQLRLP